MTRTALLLMTVALLGAADAPKDEIKNETAKFQGTWKAVSIERDGEKAMPNEQLKRLTLVIEGDKRTIKVGDEVVSLGTFRLDPSQKPKAIDVTVSEGPLQGRTLRGVYEID